MKEKKIKEKKIGQIIILCAFAIIICFSRGIWFFAEKYLDSANYENRQMAIRPVLTRDSYETFSNDYTSYFNDDLQFRNNLITINSAIDYYCFERSSSSDVAIGDNDYLFYTRTDDGDPISCYQGTNLYNEDELKAISNNCIAQRDFLVSQGKEFIIFIAPNKERVYSEYMPDRYGKPADDYAALQIYNYLKANTDLRVVYPYEELMRAKNDLSVNIWYKTDTHWNNVGAYVGARELMDELEIEMPAITDESINVVTGDNTSGDLASMLNLNKQLKHTDHEYIVEGYDDHNMETIESNYEESYIYKATNADPRRIYVIRDSFSTALAPYIGSQFTESYLRYKATYSYDDLLTQNPDIVVYETVERYAGELMDFSIQ